MKQFFLYSKLLVITLLLFWVFGTISSAFAQNHTVSGTVISETDGLPVPGVNIMIKGTNNGTITDFGGKYSIDVNDAQNDALVFSFIGYNTQELQINGRSVIDITLKEDVTGLEEVVVVGYGVTKKSDLTGAITQVKTDDIKQAAVIGIDQAMQGRAAGVQITQNSGMPGAGVSVQIRGMGTWNDSDPLYVIDGVPVEKNISFLNPSDIQSIEVLKDASASAIYGARAANGVILITTKQGQEGRMDVNVDYYSGIQSAWNFVDLTNAIEYGNTYNYIRETTGKDPNNPRHWERFFITKNLDSIGEGTNWQQEVFDPAAMHNLNISLTGGNKVSTYAVSGSYYKQNGIIKNSDFQRTSFRINSSHKLTKWLKVGENLTLSRSVAHEVPRTKGHSPQKLALVSDPLADVYRSKDDPLYGEYSKWKPIEYSLNPNPVGYIERLDNERLKNTVLGNVFLEIEPYKNLVFRSSAGTNMLFHEYQSFNPTFFESGFSQNQLTDMTERYWRNLSWLWENTISYTRDFGDHNLSAIVGYSLQKNKVENLSAKKNSFPGNNKLYRYLTLATEVTNPSDIMGGITESAMLSMLGRVNYSYAGKYLVTASVRRDGSSRFGPESEPNIGNTPRFDYFPSFALGWKLSEEKFFSENIDLINFFKLRFGWGQIGNDKMGNDFPYITAVEINSNLQNYVIGNEQVTGAAIVGKANTAIRWEISQQSNLGFDMNFLNDQITFSGDFYKKTTVDQLVQLRLPHIVGIFGNPTDLRLGGDPQMNAGEVVNKGFEFIVAYREKLKPFKYEIGINFTRNINEVLKLAEGVEPIYAGQVQGAYVSRTDVGLPIGSFYGFQTNGIYLQADDTDGDEIIDNQPTYTDNDGITQLMQPNAKPGDVRFIDQNGDGKLNIDDKVMIGSPHPDFFYGFNLQLEYRGFDFMMFWQGVYGNEIFNSNVYDWMGGGISSNFHTDILNAYRLPDENHDGNTATDIPRLDGNQSNGNYSNISDLYIEDGSYLRLKNTQIGYSLPKTILSKIGLNNLRIYIGAQNLFTLTKYRGYDPEIGRTYNDYGIAQDFNNTRSLEMGIDWGSYPQSRTFMFGVNLSF